MRLERTLRVSLRALLAHRLRSGLATASTAIGVAAVMLTSAMSKGADAELRESLGATSDLVVVRPAQTRRLAGRPSVKGLVTTLRPDDADAMASLPSVAAVAGALDGSARVGAGRGSLPVGLLGASPSYLAIRGLRLRHGRFLDSGDDATGACVAVLGARVGRTLYGSGDPVGSEIRVRGIPFEVIGILAADGMKADGADQDGTVFVPLRTAMRRVLNTRSLTAVFLSVDERDAAAVRQGVRALLRERHRIAPDEDDDFAIQDQARLVAMQREAIASLRLVSSGLAGLALLVGGFGILALMLVSVKERTAEIGLRMAVGARSRDVLLHFLAEAATLALAGWVVGAALAGAGLVVAASATDWTLGLPAGAVAVSLLTVLALGLGSGALPARRAARQTPIDALRSAS